MLVNKLKLQSFIKQNWGFYLLGLGMIWGMKYFYSQAGLEDLKWILAPTSRWAGILAGIPFEWEPDSGYVNHSARFIIAASCSGFQFMIITTATLIYSFMHQIRSLPGRFCWMIASPVMAYPFTVLINGLRIVTSIYLPPHLRGIMINRGWLTPEKLHTIIGIVSFFFALLLLYHTVGAAFDKITVIRKKKAGVIDSEPYSNSRITFFNTLRKCISPIFWYFFIMLGIPFLNGAYTLNPDSFMEYVMLAGIVCTGIILLYCHSRLLLSVGSIHRR